ncbi:MAG: hypothetical protein GXO80_07540 [Chlorobi bacterium]|nr:hypothetical protein [Chlorobiota bacterium]
MKKNILNVILITIIFSFVASCDKEKINLKENNIDKEIAYTLPESLDITIPVKNGIPVYQNRNEMIEIANLLESEYDNRINAFVIKKGIKPKDDFDKITTENSFDVELPYRMFDKLQNYNTLYCQILDNEKKWLNTNTEPDWDKNPTAHFIENKFRILANEYGELIISDKIYHILPNGVTYEISNNDFKLLNSIRENHINSEIDNQNLKIYNGQVDVKGCHTSGKKTSYYYYTYNGSKKYLRELSFGWSVIVNGTMFKSKIISYKYQNGKWKNHSPYYISTTLHFKCYKKRNCSYVRSWNGTSGFYYRHSVTASNGWGFKRYATDHGQMSGYYKVRENNSTLFASGLTY